MNLRSEICDLRLNPKGHAPEMAPARPHSAFSIQHSAFLPASARPRVSASRNARTAFSFTEILFAVMILGIGFIMVAAMFPVALQQTENSTSDTNAANMAR